MPPPPPPNQTGLIRRGSQHQFIGGRGAFNTQPTYHLLGRGHSSRTVPQLPTSELYRGAGHSTPLYRGETSPHTTPVCSIHLLLSSFTIWKVLFKADFRSFSLCFHEYCPPSGPLINGYNNVLQYFDQNRHIGRWGRVGESVHFFMGGGINLSQPI